MTDQELIQALEKAATKWEKENPIIGVGELRYCDALRDAAYRLKERCDQLAALQAENAEKDREIERLKNDVEGMRANWYKCSNNYQKKCRDIKVLESALSHIEAEAEAALGGGKG